MPKIVDEAKLERRRLRKERKAAAAGAASTTANPIVVGVQKPLGQPIPAADDITEGLKNMAVEEFRQPVVQFKSVSSFDVPEIDNLAFLKDTQQLIAAARNKTFDQQLKFGDVANQLKNTDSIATTTAVNAFIKENDIPSAESLLGRKLTPEEIANASGGNYDVQMYTQAAREVGKDQLKKYISETRGDIYNLKDLLKENPKTKQWNTLLSILERIDSKVKSLGVNELEEVQQQLENVEQEVKADSPRSERDLVQQLTNSPPFRILGSPTTTSSLDDRSDTETVVVSTIVDSDDLKYARSIVERYGSDGSRASRLEKSEKDEIDQVVQDLKLVLGGVQYKTKVKEIAKAIAKKDSLRAERQSLSRREADDEKARNTALQLFPETYGSPPQQREQQQGQGSLSLSELAGMKKSKGSIHSDKYVEDRMRILMGSILDENDSIALRQELKDLVKFALKRNIIKEDLYNKIVRNFVYT